MQPKYLINSDNFKPGFVTPDDGWHNYWRQGQNSVYGWNTSMPDSGNGAKSMGAELANSDQFARCAVEKVFKTVCLHPPVNSADRASVDSTINTFKSGGYKLKDVLRRPLRTARAIKGMHRMKTLRLTLLGAFVALLAACSGGAPHHDQYQHHANGQRR